MQQILQFFTISGLLKRPGARTYSLFALGIRFAPEWYATSDEQEQYDSERPHIDGLSQVLFLSYQVGVHIAWCAAILTEFMTGFTIRGKPEVNYFYITGVLIIQNVLQF